MKLVQFMIIRFNLLSFMTILYQGIFSNKKKIKALKGIENFKWDISFLMAIIFGWYTY